MIIFQRRNGEFQGVGERLPAFSSGHVTDEIIQEYIKRHDNHGNHNDDDFSVE